MAYVVHAGTPILHLSPAGPFWIVGRFTKTKDFGGQVYRLPIIRAGTPALPIGPDGPGLRPVHYCMLHIRAVLLPNNPNTPHRQRTPTLVSHTEDELRDIVLALTSKCGFAELF